MLTGVHLTTKQMSEDPERASRAAHSRRTAGASGRSAHRRRGHGGRAARRQDPRRNRHTRSMAHHGLSQRSCRRRSSCGPAAIFTPGTWRRGTPTEPSASSTGSRTSSRAAANGSPPFRSRTSSRRRAGVVKAAVIAVKDAKWGERPMALVIVEPGFAGGSAQAAEEAIRAHVKSYRRQGRHLEVRGPRSDHDRQGAAADLGRQGRQGRAARSAPAGRSGVARLVSRLWPGTLRLARARPLQGIRLVLSRRLQPRPLCPAHADLILAFARMPASPADPGSTSHSNFVV